MWDDICLLFVVVIIPYILFFFVTHSTLAWYFGVNNRIYIVPIMMPPHSSRSRSLVVSDIIFVGS